MKRLTLLVCSLLAAAVCFAQPEKFPLNSLGVSVGAGTEGIGVDLAVPLGDHFAVRAGYAFTYPIKYSYTQRVDDDKAFGGIHGDITATGKLTTDNARLLVDYFPSETGSFHISAGVYAFTKPGIVNARTADPLPIPESNYARTFVELNGKYITTDPKGYLSADVRAGTLPVKPYLGIGFGRVMESRRVSLTVDLGAIYCGSLDLISYDYGVDAKASATKPVVNKFTSADADGYDNGWIDKVGATPVLPVVRINLLVRIF